MSILKTPTNSNPITMALPLQGRVAIVIGASRAISRGIASHLASLGANVLLTYSTSSPQADLLVSHLNSTSPTPRAAALQADISDPSAAKLIFDAAESAFNTPPHILITSAGVLNANLTTLSSTPLEDFDAVFSHNARGAFLCLREGASRIARGGGGRIVTISTSLLGSLLPTFGAYAASKSAVESMTRILAKELKGTGITANCVAPGPTNGEAFFEGKSEEELRRMAEMNLMGRLGEGKDVAAMIGFLCTDEGEWINGQVIRVNGGQVI